MASSKLCLAVDEVDRIIKEKLREGSPFVATAVVTQVAQKRGINARTLHRHARECDGAVDVPTGHRELSDMAEIVLEGAVITLARLKQGVRKPEIVNLGKSAFGVDVGR